MAEISRVPLEPNWREPVTMSWEFKTDIFTAREGYETRSSLREFPRIRTELNVMGGRDSDPGWRGMFARSLGQRLDFADLSYPVRAIARSGLALDGDFDNFRFSNGSAVYVRVGRRFFPTTIQLSEKTSIVLPSALPTERGDIVTVYPAMAGRIADGFSADFRTSQVSEMSVTAEGLPSNQRFVRDLVDWAPDQWYRRRPVALWQPNWKDAVSENWSRPVDELDPGYGMPWWRTYTKSPQRTGSYRVRLKSRAEARHLLSFFCYCRGQQASFYMPTWVDDMVFTQPVQQDQTLIRVKGQHALALFAGSNVFKSIAIPFQRGVHLSPIIDAYSIGNDSEMVLAAPIPAAFVGASRASWLLRQRFSMDKLEFEYLTDSVIEASISTMSLIDDFGGLTILGKEVTIGGDYVTYGQSRSTVRKTELVTIGGYQMSISGDFVDQ